MSTLALGVSVHSALFGLVVFGFQRANAFAPVRRENGELDAVGCERLQE